MRRAMIMVAAMACCWVAGCQSTFDVGRISWRLSSIPPGVWHLEINVPGYHSTSSVDPLKGIDLLIRGLVPIK